MILIGVQDDWILQVCWDSWQQKVWLQHESKNRKPCFQQSIDTWPAAPIAFVPALALEKPRNWCWVATPSNQHCVHNHQWNPGVQGKEEQDTVCTNGLAWAMIYSDAVGTLTAHTEVSQRFNTLLYRWHFKTKHQNISELSFTRFSPWQVVKSRESLMCFFVPAAAVTVLHQALQLITPGAVHQRTNISLSALRLSK